MNNLAVFYVDLIPATLRERAVSGSTLVPGRGMRWIGNSGPIGVHLLSAATQ